MFSEHFRPNKTGPTDRIQPTGHQSVTSGLAVFHMPQAVLPPACWSHGSVSEVDPGVPAGVTAFHTCPQAADELAKEIGVWGFKLKCVLGGSGGSIYT